MSADQGNDAQRLARLSAAADPGEFIKMFRRMMAEENHLPEQFIFPVGEDGARDLLSILLGVWLAMTRDLPLDSKAVVIASMERMRATLEEMKQYVPEDEEQLKRDVLHCLRRGVTPEYWPRVK